MKYMYGIMVIAETFFILLCAIKSTRKKEKLGRSVCIYEWVALMCAVVFVLYNYIPVVWAATLFKGLILAMFDWLLIFLLFYTQYYTNVYGGIKTVKIAMCVFAVCDTVAFIANTWNHKIFSVEFIKENVIHIEFVKNSFWYQAHFLFSYATITLLIFIYFYMIVRSARLYKLRYTVIAFTLLTGFLCDIATIRLDCMYDVPMLIYGIMSVMIYYLTFIYVPNELIENMLSVIVKDMFNGIICYDNKGRCVYFNELISDIYGDHYGYEDFEKIYAQWINDTSRKRSDYMKFDSKFEIDGKTRYFDISYKRIYDEKHRSLCDYFIYIDRTDMIQSLEREKYKATHDGLTGLLTREQFFIDTHELINKYAGMKFCIIYSNIKDFKFVNELFGIEKGDCVLKRQAQIIKEWKSDKMLSARIQNDRFAMCIPKDDLCEDDLIEAVKMMQEEFANTSFHLHLFIGIYEISDRNESVSIMCDKANIAGDTIKDNYESCIAYYDEHLLEISIEERRIIGEFDMALERKEFVMFLQPQVDCDGNAYGAEALVRWQHPDRGLLTPQKFIEVLEKAGLIYKLDRYMWERAAEKLSEWKKAGLEKYHISVNISTKDFFIIDVYETFTQLIRKYDINPENLKLEITETALMSDFEKNMEILKRLQAYGFKIEIDDFGSGYSSLNMLKDISADVLKIDMGFLRASENESKGQDILESIISLAGKLGMEVITEGVEKNSQLQMLKMMGCKIFQGFYFSRPISVEEFEDKYLKI